MTDANFYTVDSVGIYCPTGCHVHDTRLTWFGGANSCGVMIGDDRGSGIAGGSVHSVISGLTLQRGRGDFKGICFAKVAGGEIKNNVVSDVVCLAGTCIDFATGFGARGPKISNNVFDAITCGSNVATCFAFPGSSQGNVRDNTIGSFASVAANAFANWTPAQARRPVDGSFTGGALALGTAEACYVGLGTVAGCPSESDAVSEFIVPADGAMGEMRCTVTAAPGAGAARQFTLQVDGSDASRHGCAIRNTATSCADQDTATPVGAGQRVRVRVSRSGATPSGGGCTVDFHRNP